MKKTILFIFVVTEIWCKAQIINQEKIPAGKDIIINVKQFSQFVERFNYNEDFWGKPVNEEFKKHFSRSDYMRILFNSEDERFGTGPVLSVYDSLVNEFISYIDKNSLKINKLSENILARASCKVIYNSTNQSLNLILRLEKINNGYRWVIYDAFSEFLQTDNFDPTEFIMPDKSEKLLFIPPVSNELNFIHLKKIFEGRTDLTPYISDSAGIGVKYLCQVLKDNKLEYKYVEKLKYFIFDIPGWIIEVEEFVRQGNNSGWLISNLEKCDNNISLPVQKLQ